MLLLALIVVLSATAAGVFVFAKQRRKNKTTIRFNNDSGDFFSNVSESSPFKLFDEIILKEEREFPLFLGDNGAFDEALWAEVKEPIQIQGQKWRAKLSKQVFALPWPGSGAQIPFTALRLIPPTELKTRLRPSPSKTKDDNAVAEYSLFALTPSTQLATFLIQISVLLEPRR